MTVKALNKKAVTPEFILNNALSEAKNFKAAFIVGITEDGQSQVWASGDLGYLTYAQMVLLDLSLKHVNGMIDDEFEFK